MGDKFKSLPKRLTYPDIPIPYSRALEKFALPDKEKIINIVKNMFK
jgi:pyruvate dehydrogenase E1 component beta subunit